MSTLPPHAHPDHLKKQAKDLLREFRSGKSVATARLHVYLARLSTSAGGPTESVSLQEVQFVLAREYGFANWTEMLSAISTGGHSRSTYHVWHLCSNFPAVVSRIVSLHN